MLKKGLFYICGLLLMSMGTVILLKSDMGVAAFDALCAGLADITSLTTGNWCMILGILIILLNAVIQKRIPSVFSFLTSIIVGICIDFWFGVIGFQFSGILLRSAQFMLGLLINSFGVALYVSADLAKGPIDQLMLNISNLVKKEVWVGKTLMEISFLLLVFAIKGPIGVGTVIVVFTSGFLIDYFLKILKRGKNYVQESECGTSQ